MAKLGNLGEVNRGRSRHRPRYAEHLYGGPYPFIQTGDIRMSGGRISSHTQTYSEAGLAQSRLWPAGTMCITIAANIAETAILNYPACFPDSVVGFIADEERANVYFVEYMFRRLRSSLQHQAFGSVQDNINLATLDRLRFPLPPLDEQRAIADVLGALDDKIEQNRRTARALERLARAIFRAWFVDFEPVKAKAEGATAFPSMPQDVFDALPTSFVDSEIGPVPDGWEVKALDKVASFLNGLALQKYPSRGDSTDLPVIKIAQLRKGSTEGADSSNDAINEKYKIQDGDLLFSWSGTLEAVFWFGGAGALNQHLFKVTSSKYPQWLVYEWIQQHLPEFRLVAASKATTMGHIKRGHLNQALVAVPSPAFMEQSNQILAPLFDMHGTAHLESRKLAEMRDYLLPKLLSGSVRVRDMRQLAEDVKP